jgi:predicted ATPase
VLHSALIRQCADAGSWASPCAQLEAIRKLQRVWDEVHALGRDREAGGSGLTLVDAVGDSASSWGLWKMIARKLEAPPRSGPPIQGLYLYGAHAPTRAATSASAPLTPARAGGVGSGKTMLMDLFYDALPPGVHKTRIHFHDFMLSVHRRLRTLNNVADPLLAVAEEFTRKNQAGGGHLVLCLDEFMVRRMRMRGTGHD